MYNQSSVCNGKTFKAYTGLVTGTSVLRLIPEEIVTRHQVFDVSSFAVGLTQVELVTVGFVLEPHLSLAVVASEAIICSYIKYM